MLSQGDVRGGGRRNRASFSGQRGVNDNPEGSMARRSILESESRRYL
jgi:hypothetical protein